MVASFGNSIDVLHLWVWLLQTCNEAHVPRSYEQCLIEKRRMIMMTMMSLIIYYVIDISSLMNLD